MQTRAYIKYQRISPKKIRELCKLTVGLSPTQALDRLSFMPGKAPLLLSAVIKSAKANAVNNLKLNSQNLVIKEVIVGKGPFFKRWQAAARGSAHQIKKRTSHLIVTVAEGKRENLPSKEKPVKEKNKQTKTKTEKKEKKNGS